MKVKITDEDIKNSAIIFETTEDSWHGVPDKIMCPENVYRKTLAFYYVSKISSPNKKKIMLVLILQGIDTKLFLLKDHKTRMMREWRSCLKYVQ